MNAREVFDKIDALTEEYTALWKRICEIESPSEDKAGVDAVGACFLALGAARGWHCEVMENEVAGNAICLTMHPEAEGRPIVLSGHMDTVHPHGLFGYPAVRTEGDLIYGPGVCDCKGGLVAAALAMAALDDLGFCARPIRLILQSDEEVNSNLSERKTLDFMFEHAKDAVAFLNCEPPGAPDRITVERKGILRYEFAITGVAAHSSQCYKGKNAIAEAAHKILALEEWKDPDGITCSCGVIEGGDAPNTVAKSCRFVADIRYKEGDRERVIESVRKVAEHSSLGDTTCILTLKSERIPMGRCERNLSLFARVREILLSCNFPEPCAYAANGGADSADMTAAGIPTLDSLGTLGGRIHSADEYSYLSALPAAAKRLAAIALSL